MAMRALLDTRLMSLPRFFFQTNVMPIILHLTLFATLVSSCLSACPSKLCIRLGRGQANPQADILHSCCNSYFNYRFVIRVSNTDQDGATCVVSEWTEHLPLYNEVWEESHWWHLCYLGHVDTPLQRNSRDHSKQGRNGGTAYL